MESGVQIFSSSIRFMHIELVKILFDKNFFFFAIFKQIKQQNSRINQ